MRSLPKVRRSTLPPGHYNRIYLLAASAGGDQKASFQLGEQDDRSEYPGLERIYRSMGYAPLEEPVRTRLGYLRQSRAVAARRFAAAGAAPCHRQDIPTTTSVLNQGYVKPASPAWFASHHHTRRWAQPAVSLLLPLCLFDGVARRRTDTEVARQRKNPRSRRLGGRRKPGANAGATALRPFGSNGTAQRCVLANRFFKIAFGLCRTCGARISSLL